MGKKKRRGRLLICGRKSKGERPINCARARDKGKGESAEKEKGKKGERERVQEFTPTSLIPFIRRGK